MASTLTESKPLVCCGISIEFQQPLQALTLTRDFWMGSNSSGPGEWAALLSPNIDSISLQSQHWRCAERSVSKLRQPHGSWHVHLTHIQEELSSSVPLSLRMFGATWVSRISYFTFPPPLLPSLLSPLGLYNPLSVGLRNATWSFIPAAPACSS